MSADIRDTLQILLSVLKYDIIECWTVHENHDATCDYLLISSTIRQLFPYLESMKPCEMKGWREMSLQVSNYLHYISLLTIVISALRNV